MKFIYRIFHHIGNQWKKTFESTDKSAFDEQVMLDYENGANIDTETITTKEVSK